MNDNQTVPNLLLREHSTQTAFSLVLSRRMIAALDDLAHSDKDRNQDIIRGWWVPSAASLIKRGLALHKYGPNFSGQPATHHSMKDPLTDYYRLTKAGWLMHDLLAEAGLVSAVTDKKLRKLVA